MTLWLVMWPEHEADGVHSVWTTESGAQAELARLNAAEDARHAPWPRQNATYYVVAIEADTPSDTMLGRP
jgi:hypothetical protein